jgi:deoxyribodipyrimidine photo-lyase
VADKQSINIVWLKRDLRVQDHAAFDAADKSELPVLPIFIFEPSQLSNPDCSKRHLLFQYHSILGINDSATKRWILLFLAFLLIVNTTPK